MQQTYEDYYNMDTGAGVEKPAMTMATGGNITDKYRSQVKLAGEHIKVDPAERFKTE